MTQRDPWSAVDDYISSTLVPSDDELDAALAASEAAGLPAIQVSAAQGKFLLLLAKILNARSILEVGTLGGYSAIWLARALPPEGRLVTLEADPKHASVARSNVARAGLASLVDVRVGLALDLLPNVRGPFDLTFLDADKINNANYFDWALRLSHVGSVIVIDNVVRDGKVIDTSSTDPGVVGVRRLNERIMNEPRVSATTLQTVGHKGYDGFTLVRVERA
jgi:predicted O-methyltransferase YrrM